MFLLNSDKSEFLVSCVLVKRKHKSTSVEESLQMSCVLGKR